jgi:hypothetical protein
VAHPDDLIGREVVEQRRGAVEVDVGLAVLRDVVRLDRPAELAGHQLHAVTDAERRDAQREDSGIGERRPVRVHGRRAAREDERRRVALGDLLGSDAVRHELRVDARLADATRDQLAVLAAEVEDEHGPLLGRRLGARERNDLGRLSHGGSSAPPW